MPIIIVDPWRPVDEQSGGTRVADLAGLLEQLEGARGRTTLIVAVDGPATRVARTARHVMSHRDTGLLSLNDLPTARWLLELMLLMLPAEDYRRAGALVEYARHFVVSHALVSSVTKLSNPTPSLTQHIRALFPDSWFNVDVTRGTIVGQKSIDWSLDTRPLSAFAGSTGWQERLAWVPLPEQGYIIDGPQSHSQWSAKTWLEASSLLYAPDDVVAHVLASVPGDVCPRCAHSTLASRCLFCGTVEHTSNYLPSSAQPSGVVPR